MRFGHDNLAGGGLESGPALGFGSHAVQVDKWCGLLLRRAAVFRDVLAAEIDDLRSGESRWLARFRSPTATTCIARNGNRDGNRDGALPTKPWRCDIYGEPSIDELPWPYTDRRHHGINDPIIGESQKGDAAFRTGRACRVKGTPPATCRLSRRDATPRSPGFSTRRSALRPAE
jgi:hypothetical protein